MLFGSGGALAKLQQGVGGVVLEEGLEEHANGAKDTDEDEDPQEEAVDDHGHVLPVLAHLCGAGRNAGSGWGLRYCLTLTAPTGNLAYPQSLESAPSALQLPASPLWAPRGSLPLQSPALLSPGNTSPVNRAGGGLCKICSLTVPCRARPPGTLLGFQSSCFCFSLGLQWWVRDQCWTPYPLGTELGRCLCTSLPVVQP